MRAGSVCVIVMLLLLAVSVSNSRGTPAHASETLSNTAFNGLSGWDIVPSGAVSTPSSCSCAETTAAQTVISQFAIAAPNVAYTGRATVTPQAGSTGATLSVTLFDSGLSPIPGASRTAAGNGPGSLFLEAVVGAHPAAAYVQFEVRTSLTTATSARISSPSLTAVTVANPPTSTPPPTNTPTPRPTATPAAPGQPTATPTPRQNATPTPRSTPTPRATPTRRTNPTATPTRPAPPATPTPTLPASTVGGLLYNGGFEILSGGAPAGWSKVGGTLTASASAYAGNRSGSLYSQTSSTKWLFQSVPVTAGNWYRANTVGRVASGSAELFIRVSWYASANGSGSTMSQVDSGSTTSGSWRSLSSGTIQAPAGANSARVRLMLRPSGPATGQFDQATFVTTTQPPTPTPEPMNTPGATPQLTPGGSTTPSATPRGATPTATRTARPSAPRGATPASPSRPSGPSTPAPRAQGPAPTGSHALALSEVFSDAPESGNDGAYEWIEVVNHGEKAIDLAGWVIGDAIREDTLPSLVIPPGGFGVIAGPDAALPPDTPVVRVPDGTIGAGLNNGGDAVRLLAPGGTLIDAMSFGEDTSVFDPGPPAPGPGESIATDGPRGGWMLSSETTPGQPNAFPAIETPETTATAATGTAGTISASEPTTPGAADDREIIDEAASGSSVPGFILAATVGAGAVGIGIGARRLITEKWRRGS